MQDNPVVVHYGDGRTLSGYGEDFHPMEAEVILREASTDERVTVYLKQVKVICFVRSLGTSGVVRNREQPPIIRADGSSRRAEMDFRDGEHLGGFVSLSESPTRGFFLTPLNANGNNIRIYVNPAYLVSFRFVT